MEWTSELLFSSDSYSSVREMEIRDRDDQPFGDDRAAKRMKFKEGDSDGLSDTSEESADLAVVTAAISAQQTGAHQSGMIHIPVQSQIQVN